MATILVKIVTQEKVKITDPHPQKLGSLLFLVSEGMKNL